MRTALPQAGSIARTGTTKTAHIIVPESWWVMTYQGQVCQIKDTDAYSEDHRYRRNGWTSETTARTQAAKLNAQFRSQDFGVRQIQGMEYGTSTSKT